MQRPPVPQFLKSYLILLVGLAVGGSAYAQTPIGTAFTYQGRLTQAGSAAEGNFDIRFILMDAEVGGSQVGPILTVEDVAIIEGVFTLELDFELEAFSGGARWLEVAVRPGEETGVFSPLVPRQRLRPVPHALVAGDADTLDGLDSTDLLAATTGIQSLVREFQVSAGESLEAGQVVSFLTGTSEVRKGYDPVGIVGEATFTETQVNILSAATLSPSKFVVAYRHPVNPLNGRLAIGELTGGSVVIGDEIEFESALIGTVSVAALDADRFVIAYQDGGNSGFGTAVVGEISGDAVTFGEKAVYSAAATEFLGYVSVAALSSSKFLVAFADRGDSDAGMAVVGEVTGNSIAFGAAAVFNPTTTAFISTASLSSTRCVVAFSEVLGSEAGTAVAGEVSGNSISFGPEVRFNSNETAEISAAALSPDRCVVAYQDTGDGGFGTAALGMVSGNAITFGPRSIINPGNTSRISVTPLSSTRCAVTFADGENSGFGTVALGEASGSIVGFDFGMVFNPATTFFLSAFTLSANQIGVAYLDAGNTMFGRVAIARVSSSPLIGVARAAGSGGATVPVTLFVNRAISDTHADLIPGQTYFAQTDGSISTDDSGVPLGVAVSATEILFFP